MSSPIDSPSNPFRDPSAGDAIADSPVLMQDPSQDTSGVVSSADASRPSSAAGRRREKKKVGFTGGSDSAERSSRRISWMEVEPSGQVGGTLSPPNIGVTPPADSPEGSGHTTPNHSRSGSNEHMLPPPASPLKSHLPELSPQQTQQIHNAFNLNLPIPKPRPAIRRAPSNQSTANTTAEDSEEPDEGGMRAYRQARAREAYERGKRLETDERSRSEPNSRYTSPERKSRSSRRRLPDIEIPLQDLAPRHQFDGNYDSDSDAGFLSPKPKKSEKSGYAAEALRLVRKHTTLRGSTLFSDAPDSALQSTVTTPTEEKEYYETYTKRPDQYHGGILGALLKLNGAQAQGEHSRSSSAHELSSRWSSADVSTNTTPNHSPPDSGASTPSGAHWYGRKHKNLSTSSLAQLIGSSASLGSPGVTGLGEQVSQRLKDYKEQEKQQQRPGFGERIKSSDAVKLVTRKKQHTQMKVVARHIGEVIMLQEYLTRLCKALMQYGAPTHRLEEYMNMSSRTLRIQAQFLYIPGSMIMSFEDPETHTTEVKLVRVQQGLDLGKLRDVHEVYKDVVHDRTGAEDGIKRLKEVAAKPDKHSRWLRIPIYGLAAVCVGPWAFESRLIDLPIAFLLGCILGTLQLVVAPRSDLYANVFEISATVITSFLSRAFGSIPDGNGGRLFCFSALAQSSIALILPGYIVLCASLELQSRSIVAGSIRMVYAIIYSLFLGFGITIGTAIYGIMDSNAVSATSCSSSMPEPYFFPFVPAFAMCLIIINQAKWKQAPMMLVIAFVGYLVNFYSSKRFAGNTQVSNTLGALAIGVMANTYSRIGSRIENWALDIWEDRLRHYWKGFKRRVLRIKKKSLRSRFASAKNLEEGSIHDGESLYVRQTRRVGYSLAAAAMLPAIFVQVPSGIAVSGSLVAGIASADQISGNATNGTTVANSTTISSGEGLNSVAFTVSYSVIQVAIGITVGLFLSAIVVYPFGKKRSGLFSF